MSLPYTPLDANKAEIRVLNLLPAQFSEPLLGTLEIVSLHDPPIYEALSYVWGDTTFQKHIIVDGESFEVTASLESALRALRKEDVVHTVWADALCINQHDTLEKNVLVPLMGRIYAAASSVAVWLGPSSPDTEFAMKWCIEREQWLIDQESDKKQAELYGDPHHERLSNGILSLLEHPYWERMWTYQEFRLSKNDPSLLSGNQRLRSGALLDIIDLSKLPDKNRNTRMLLTTHELNREACKEQSTDFGTLLVNTQTRQCQDPRDHVYSLYGLMPDVAKALTPDYNAPAKQVMHKTAVYLVSTKRQDDVSMLTCMKIYRVYEDRLVDTALPSWIPDFSSPYAVDGLPHKCPTFQNLFIAFTQGATAELSNDGLVLMLRARTLGAGKVSFRFSRNLEGIIVELSQLAAVLNPTAPRRNQRKSLFLDALSRILAAHATYEEFTLEEVRSQFLELADFKDGSITVQDDFVRVLRRLSGKTVLETTFGNAVISEAHVEDGDVVVTGRPTDGALILRPQKSEEVANTYRFVGHAYVDGATKDKFNKDVYVDQELVTHVTQQELTTFSIE